MRVAVLGGGPAGLVALKHLITAHQFFDVEPIEAYLFEAEDQIGGTFRFRTYEDAELVSSRQLTCFSDFRIADNEADFVKTTRYCQYLEDYCTYFGLWPHIRLSHRIQAIRRAGDKGHIVSFCKGADAVEEWPCDAVAISSGLHVTPDIPIIPGIEHIPISMHSSEFKLREDFGVGKSVWILGSGETGMDLAYLAVTSPTKTVTLSHRSGWQNAPKISPDPVIMGDLEGWKKRQEKLGPPVPIDTSSSSLFDTAYVHPQLEKTLLLWHYYDRFVKYSDWLATGTWAGLDQWVGGIPADRYHASKFIPNKSNNAMPYISAPYKPKPHERSRVEARRAALASSPPVDLKGRHIDLAPWPTHVDSNGIVHFQDTGRPEAKRMKDVTVKPDMVIYATGYTQRFPFLDSSYPLPEQADMRRIWRTGDGDVAFIGFVRPNFGAIPPLAEMQAQLWITQLLGKLPRPLKYEDDYRLKMPPDRRIQYGVDHESYAYQLALDMGSAPSIFRVALRGGTVLASWALGVNFNTKFRMVGPWKWDGADAIMKGELWRVVLRRRGPFAWIGLTFLPMVLFGTLSFWFFIVFGAWDVLTWAPRRVARAWRYLWSMLRARVQRRGYTRLDNGQQQEKAV